MVKLRKVICQFQCNVRAHAHRNNRQYLPLIVGHWFVKISIFLPFHAYRYAHAHIVVTLVKFYLWILYCSDCRTDSSLLSSIGKSGKYFRKLGVVLYLWTVSMKMWFGKQIVMTQFRKMFKIRFPAVINISIYKTSIQSQVTYSVFLFVDVNSLTFLYNNIHV